MHRFLFATVVLLICRPAIACDGFILDAKTQMERADVVFAGHAESVELIQRPSPQLFTWWRFPWPPHEGNRVVFRVSTLLKGQTDKRVT
ncbi:MAG: hypothetical protein ACRD3J_29570, partial [Thermoanaerobaculia bacterium]